MPRLTDPDKGEPRMTTDFRCLCNALLADWMGLLPDKQAQKLEPVGLFSK